MGIKNLTQLLKEFCPNAIKEITGKEYFRDRWIAIDASTSLQQFLVAIRSSSDQYSTNGGLLVNKDNEVTSHLQGFMNRTIAMMEMNIKPIQVFDGKPPDMKKGELAKRREAKEIAKEKQDKAIEEGNAEEAFKQAKRNVKITKEMKQQTIDLLNQMGVPTVEAPAEAEATCVELLKKGQVQAVASEDSDCLTHGCEKLVRFLFNNRKDKNGKVIPPTVFHLDIILNELELQMNEFVDLCVLCGCDQLDSPKGMGHKTAYKLIKEYRTIENIIANNKIKETETTFIENQAQARGLFLESEVLKLGDDFKLKLRQPEEEKLIELMVTKNDFSKEIIEKRIATLKSFDRSTKQTRIQDFFKSKKVITNDKAQSNEANTSMNKSGQKTAVTKDKKKKK